jgi:hypothetical protein
LLYRFDRYLYKYLSSVIIARNSHTLGNNAKPAYRGRYKWRFPSKILLYSKILSIRIISASSFCSFAEFEKSKPSKIWMVSNVLSFFYYFPSFSRRTNSEFSESICFFNYICINQNIYSDQIVILHDRIEIGFCFSNKLLLDKSKHLDHIDVAVYKTFFDYHKSTVNPLIVNARVLYSGILNNSKHCFKSSIKSFFVRALVPEVSKTVDTDHEN